MVQERQYRIEVEVFTYGEYDYTLLSHVTMLVVKEAHVGIAE